MRSLKLMAQARFFVLFIILFCFQTGFSQINSPYSRYGLGDLYNSRNVMNKGMGNLVSPVVDLQSVNFLNPASYSRLQAVSFDVGLEYENRKLLDASKADSYKSNNLSFNYLALGIPIMKDKKGFSKWGMALGIRPVTRMNYNISVDERLPGIDSINTVYQGNGGASKAYAGTGFRVKGFSLGVNVGILFGQHEISTQKSFINDTVQYYASNHQRQFSYSKLYFDGGAQWDIKVGRTSVVRLAATGFIGGDVNAKTDILRETIYYNGTGGFDSVDVVERKTNQKGVITMPSGYTLGIAFEKTGVWMIGGEYERINWSDYRFYGQTDQVGNYTMFRFGGNWTPATTTKKYINRITYRAGFYTGEDYVQYGGKQLPVTAGTIGFGFPIRRWNTYSNQFTVINTAFEFGKRGNGSQPITENFFRLNIGLCLSDLWFNKRRFD